MEASIIYGTGEGELEGTGADDPEDSDDENGNSEEEGEEGSELGASALSFTGRIAYYFKAEGRFRPYVTAGAGLARIDVESQTDTRPVGVLGGGVMVTVSRTLLVRADLRDQIYTLDSGAGSSTRNELALTGGVSFRF